jgi:hypothetical protein
MSSRFLIPPIIELSGFFGADPVEESIEDTYVCYEIADARGVKLRFSLAAIERSVQTVLSVAQHSMITVSHEQATQLSVHRRILRCEFSGKDCKTKLTIDLNDGICVVWATLETG